MRARVLVVGAGAIGGVIAAKLSLSGHDIEVLDANPEHVALLRDPGLVLEQPGSPASTVPLRAATTPDQLTGPFDFALITLKSTALTAALTTLDAQVDVDTYVSLGNGLVHDLIGSIVGRQRLIVGVVEWGATNLGPGRVVQTTRAPTALGEPDGSTSHRLTGVCSILNDIGEAQTSAAVMGKVWSKLLLNSTLSGLGTVAGGLYRDISSDAVGRKLALQVWTEGYHVARALDMPLGPVFGVEPRELVVVGEEDLNNAGDALDRLMVGAGATRASMLQDLERSLPTEVDVINGGVVRSAHECGRAAPLNAQITRIIHDCEAGRSEPQSDVLRLLAKVGGSAREAGALTAIRSASGSPQSDGLGN